MPECVWQNHLWRPAAKKTLAYDYIRSYIALVSLLRKAPDSFMDLETWRSEDCRLQRQSFILNKILPLSITAKLKFYSCIFDLVDIVQYCSKTLVTDTRHWHLTARGMSIPLVDRVIFVERHWRDGSYDRFRKCPRTQSARQQCLHIRKCRSCNYRPEYDNIITTYNASALWHEHAFVGVLAFVLHYGVVAWWAWIYALLANMLISPALWSLDPVTN